MMEAVTTADASANPSEGLAKPRAELKGMEGGEAKELKPKYRKGATRKSQGNVEHPVSLKTGLKAKEKEKGKEKEQEKEKTPTLLRSPKRDRLSHRRKTNTTTSTNHPLSKANGNALTAKNNKDMNNVNPSPRSIKKRMTKTKTGQPKRESIRQKGAKHKGKKNVLSDNSIENKKDKNKLKKSKSVYENDGNNGNNEETNESNKNMSEYSDAESVIENISIHQEETRKEDISAIQAKILDKYRVVFSEYARELMAIVKSENGDGANILSATLNNSRDSGRGNDKENDKDNASGDIAELSRRELDTLMRVSFKCLDYPVSTVSAVMLLLHRVRNPEIELMDSEKENIEHILRLYANRFITSYKIVFKIHYKKVFKDSERAQGPLSKDLFKQVRMKMKNKFLLTCEIVLNLITCILHTVYSDDDRIYYVHLRGQLYKFISDITETGFKYKYEKLAKEAYEEALLLANRCLKPTDLLYLNLVNNYIYFLYYVLAQEQEALEMCVYAFDRATLVLDQIVSEEDQESCIQLLSKMRFNIKRWTKNIHKNSLLFLNF